MSRPLPKPTATEQSTKEETRRCSVCAQFLPLSSFYTYWDKRRNKTYTGSRCKPCNNTTFSRHVYEKRKTEPEREGQYRSLQSERNARYYLKLRLDVLLAYCPDGPACACCGESEVAFLTVDHVNGDGAEHRRTVGHGPALLRWLRDQHYPEGFQVLCANCNTAKFIYGRCPHKSNHN